MASVWITFRLHKDGTYDARYKALIEAVTKHRKTNWWFEPTSFLLIDSDSTRASIAASVKTAINTRTDLVLIGSMEQTGATLVGTADKLADLKRLVPGLATA